MSFYYKTYIIIKTSVDNNITTCIVMNTNISPAKMLPREPSKCYYNRNKHKYALIDASAFLNKFGIGTYNGKTIIVNNDGKNISDIYLTLVATVRFLTENMIPVFVFDGKSPQVKSEVVTKRREVKKQADDVLREKYSEEIDPEKKTDTPEKKTDTPERTLDELIKHLKRSYRIDKHTIETFKAILRYMGLPLIEAPAEADPQCVAIASYYNKEVVGIVTDDFDFLMYGAKNILKYQNIGSNHMEMYSLDAVLSNMKTMIIEHVKTSEDIELKAMYDNKSINFTHNNMLDIGCLIGTDYCHIIPLQNQVEKNKFSAILNIYLKNGMSLNALLESERDNIGDAFIERMQKSKLVYRDAEVIHPKHINLTFQKPNIKMIKNLCEDIFETESLASICSIVEESYTQYIKMQKERKQGRYNHEILEKPKKFIKPEPRTRIPITVEWYLATQTKKCIYNNVPIVLQDTSIEISANE